MEHPSAAVHRGRRFSGDVWRKEAVCCEKEVDGSRRPCEGGHCGCKYLWQPSGKHLDEIVLRPSAHHTR